MVTEAAVFLHSYGWRDWWRAAGGICRPKPIASLALLNLVALLVAPAAAGTPWTSMGQEEIQEVILRVKLAAVLIGVRVQGQAAVSCEGEPAKNVLIQPRVSTGTGFVVHPDGYIATNAHVVGPVREALAEEDLEELSRDVVASACADRLASLSSAERQSRIDGLARRPESKRGLSVERRIEVTFQDGKGFPATVLASRPLPLQPPPAGAAPGGTPPGDVAIIRVSRRDLVAAPLGRTPVQIGDQVFVIGYPGVVLDHELLSPRSRQAPSVTLGRVSGFKLDLAEHEVIQTDAAITWGNSGGPAFDVRGEVIGVATFISAGPGEGPNVQGFNFLVPIERVTALATTIGLAPASDSVSGRRWRAAVRAFFAGRYDSAIAELEAIIQRDPNFPDARRLLSAARARPERGSPEWGRWMEEMQAGWSARQEMGGGTNPGGTGLRRPR